MKKTKTLKEIVETASISQPVKVHTEKDTAVEVLTLIRQHEPEEQNKILEAVLRELVMDRKNRYEAAAIDQKRAAENLETFMAIGRFPDMTIKEFEIKKNGY